MLLAPFVFLCPVFCLFIPRCIKLCFTVFKICNYEMWTWRHDCRNPMWLFHLCLGIYRQLSKVRCLNWPEVWARFSHVGHFLHHYLHLFCPVTLMWEQVWLIHTGDSDWILYFCVCLWKHRYCCHGRPLSSAALWCLCVCMKVFFFPLFYSPFSWVS